MPALLCAHAALSRGLVRRSPPIRNILLELPTVPRAVFHCLLVNCEQGAAMRTQICSHQRMSHALLHLATLWHAVTSSAGAGCCEVAT